MCASIMFAANAPPSEAETEMVAGFADGEDRIDRRAPCSIPPPSI